MLCPEFPTFNKKPSPLLAWNGVGTCTSVLITLPQDAQRPVTLSRGAGLGFNLDSVEAYLLRLAHIVIPLTGDMRNVIWGTSPVPCLASCARHQREQNLFWMPLPSIPAK
jgi:hypothetical protein